MCKFWLVLFIISLVIGCIPPIDKTSILMWIFAILCLLFAHSETKNA